MPQIQNQAIQNQAITPTQRVFFKTFGCRSNLYDTQVMIGNLKNFHIANSESEADIIVINSCTVTNKADREARSYARGQSLAGKKVIFTGCGVKGVGKSLFANNLIFSLFSHSHKEGINEILKSESRVFLAREKSANHIDKSIFPQVVGKVRGFIKIQEGCDFKCSYCIIPSVRGRARSFDESQILEQIKILVSGGCVSEIVLTGTNIGSYGLDTGRHIAELLRKICDIDGVRRVRLGSLEPSQIDSRFLDVLELEKIERHLHIALQHTSPWMLKIMNRKNAFEQDLELFKNLAKLGFSLGTDYIIGHHGESQEVFAEALQNLKKLPLTHIHPFIYSPRLGTISAKNEMRLESVRGDVAKARLKMIREIVRLKNLEFRKKNNNKTLKVLIDGERILDPSFIESGGFGGVYSSGTLDSGKAKHRRYLSGLDEYFNRILVPFTDDQAEKNKDNFESLDPDLTLKKGMWLEINNYEVSEKSEYSVAKNFRIL